MPERRSRHPLSVRHCPTWRSLVTAIDARLWLQVAIVAAMTVAVGWTVDRWRTARSTHRPGPIEISIESATPGETATNGAAVLAAIREQIDQLELWRASTVPGGVSTQPFLSDVRNAVEKASGWALVGATVGAAIRQPSYKLRCTVREGRADASNWLTVDIVPPNGRDGQTFTVSGSSWPDVARQVAHGVGAFVLSRARVSKLAPWQSWRGLRVDRDLFAHFYEARTRTRSQPEAALAELDEAIALDPLNAYLRFEKAGVLEQMGLYSTLATYVDVVGLERQFDHGVDVRYRELFAAADSQTGWWGAPLARWLGRRVGRPFLALWTRPSPNGPAALQLARYRLAISLASSERLALQWTRRASRKDEGQPARQREAEHAIRRLQDSLHAYTREMLRICGASAAAKAQKAAEQAAWSDVESHSGRLRRVLQFAALQEFAPLR